MRCTPGPFPLVTVCPKEKEGGSSDPVEAAAVSGVAGKVTLNSTSGSVAGVACPVVAETAKFGCATMAGVALVAEVTVAEVVPYVALAVLFLVSPAAAIF